MPPHSTASGAIRPAPSSGARLITADGRALPLEWVDLVSEAGGGLARSTLRQRFRNTEAVPVEVTYLVPLPADGAVSGYSFELAGLVTRGVVEKTQLAREHYEEALMQGKSAALLEEERSSVFRQSLGNIPPGQHIDISLTIDQPLAWVSDGWELRFPTVVAPRYQSTSSDPSSVVPVALGPEHESAEVRATHQVSLAIADALTQRPSSPSHALTFPNGDDARKLRINGARLDRDVVIRWGVATPAPGARLETARVSQGQRRDDTQFGLLTITPPNASAQASSVARDLIVLLDTSGSMQGEPLAQAVKVTNALVLSLGERDSLELIEFGSSTRRWKREAVLANAAHRAEALTWLRALRAGGGTEMKSGIEAALVSLRPNALRQIVLVTDGLIGFEREILQTLLRRLPASCRLHTVGIGHGTNRSLLEPAARAGRGLEIIVAPGEDVEPACARLLARTAQPLVVNLRLGGSALAVPPERPLDLYAGSPALIPLTLRPEGGLLEVLGDTADGRYTQRLEVPGCEPGSGPARVLSLFARQRVAELELISAAGARPEPGIDAEIEALGIDFQISTRLTSWVAVSDATTVDPRSSTRRIEQPHQLAAGMSAEGVGLRSPGGLFGMARVAMGAAAAPGGVAMSRVVMRSRGPVGAAPPMAAAPVGRGRGPSAGEDVSFDGIRPSGGGEERERGISGGSQPPQFEWTDALDELSSSVEVLRERGVVRVNTASHLVVSFTMSRAHAWSLPARIVLELADGQKVEVEVEAKFSTQAGELTAGSEVRLVMKLERALPGAPAYIYLPTTPQGVIEIVV
ncbi:MAG TPA: VIT domain-containing protein [Polyangiaceae bacterium]|nr:VIT domain-containing protein [Polyangiaceae bacterium]